MDVKCLPVWCSAVDEKNRAMEMPVLSLMSIDMKRKVILRMKLPALDGNKFIFTSYKVIGLGAAISGTESCFSRFSDTVLPGLSLEVIFLCCFE